MKLRSLSVWVWCLTVELFASAICKVDRNFLLLIELFIFLFIKLEKYYLKLTEKFAKNQRCNETFMI